MMRTVRDLLIGIPFLASMLLPLSCAHRSSTPPAPQPLERPEAPESGPLDRSTDRMLGELSAEQVSWAGPTPAWGPREGAPRPLSSSSRRFQAEEEDDRPGYKDGKMISVLDAQPFLTPVSDYTGEFPHRTTITGDWGGTRQDLFDRGFAFDVALTQTFQAVAAGGDETGDTGYNALIDYGITLDTARMGLWPGGLFVVNAQAAFESGLPVRDGAISPSDFTEVLPTLGRPKTTLMEYYFIQGLSDDFGVLIGRLNPVAWDRNRLAFNPRNQFLNMSMDLQILVGGLVGFSTYTFSSFWAPNEHVNILAGVFEPEIQPDEFSKTLFAELGTYIVIETKWKLGEDLDGTARWVAVYETSESTAIDNPRLLIDEALGLGLETRSGNYMFGINFEQYIWKPDHLADYRVGARGLDYSTSEFGFQEPGLGVFARFAMLPASRNAYNVSVSLGLEGRGLIEGRPLDRMGIGGFWLKSSNDLEGLADELLGDEWGVEVFYNYAITPSIQLTLDLQYLSSGIDGEDDALVVGLRLFTQF